MNLDEEKEVTTNSLEKKSPIQANAAAKIIVRKNTTYAAGIGLIPVPMVDATLVLGLQALMIKDLAKIYEVPFKEHIAKSIITTMIGNLGIIGGIKLIPGLGSLLGGIATAISAGAATYALGKIFTQHFSQGGTLLNFDPVQSRKHFQKAYEEGKLLIADIEAVPKKENRLKTLWDKIRVKPNDIPKDSLTSLEEEQNELKELIENIQIEMADLKKKKEQKCLKEEKLVVNAY